MTVTFTATVIPTDSALPITYCWQAEGQAVVIHLSDTLSDSISYTWLVGGSYHVALTVENAGGRFTAERVIRIQGEHLILLPFIVH